MANIDLYQEAIRSPGFKNLSPEYQNYVLGQLRQAGNLPQPGEKVEPRATFPTPEELDKEMAGSVTETFRQKVKEVAKEQTLPTIGGIAGGLLGSLIPIPGAAPVGAGLGAGTGSYLTDIARGRDPSLIKAGLEGALTAGMTAVPGLARSGIGMMRSSRPLHIDKTAAILAKYHPKDVESLKAYYMAAESFTSKGVPRYLIPTRVIHPLREQPTILTFTQAQEQLQGFKTDALMASRKGNSTRAQALRDKANFLLNDMDIALPKFRLGNRTVGFRETQSGWHRYQSVGRLQKIAASDDPVAAFDKIVNLKRITGTKGEIMQKGGDITAKAFSVTEQGEIRDILGKLGHKVGERLWSHWHLGQAAGRVGGAMIAGGSGAATGHPILGTITGGVALAGPEAINAVIGKLLTNKTGRLVLKRVVSQAGWEKNPALWSALSRVADVTMKELWNE